MGTQYLRNEGRRHFETPQSQPIPGREDEMAKNDAGGYSFKADRWKQLERFLILGSEGGSYYTEERELTTRNTTNLQVCIAENASRVIAMARDISREGRAYKNDPAIFALAEASLSGNDQTKAAAYDAIPDVCRIPTHLFHFCMFRAYLSDGKSPWGAGMRRAISHYYLTTPVDKLAYQVLKYQQREGWSHKRLLKLAHPKVADPVRNAIVRWVLKKEIEPNLKHKLLAAYEELKDLRDPNLISMNQLPREAVPTEMLNDPLTWEALLGHMPMTALFRNLGNLTKVGTLKPLSAITADTASVLTDTVRLQDARIHPIQVLLASKVYSSGEGVRGKGTWLPLPQIIGALDQAYEKTFKLVEPTHKRLYVAIDVSGSMNASTMGSCLTCAEAAAAMAVLFARTEPQVHFVAFAGDSNNYHSTNTRQFPIHKGTTLTEAMRIANGMNFGATDCALPIIDATNKTIFVDAFIIITDGQTWAGKIHPQQALNRYRRLVYSGAKLCVMYLEAQDKSITDPLDTGCLDVVGFDSSVPEVVRDFIRG